MTVGGRTDGAGFFVFRGFFFLAFRPAFFLPCERTLPLPLRRFCSLIVVPLS